MSASVVRRPHPFGALTRILTPAGEVAAFPDSDLPAAPDARRTFPRVHAALVGLVLPLVLATAPGEVAQGYAYRDVVALALVYLLVTGVTLLVRWERHDESWLFGIVGLDVVIVASLATMTGGGRSAYFALYAPILALAGWYLRRALVVLAIGLVVGTEVWRTAILEGRVAIQQVAIALPFFALVALVALTTAERLLGALTAIRQDQIRAARALAAVGEIGQGWGDPVVDLAEACERVFEAVARVVRLPEAGRRSGRVATTLIAAGGYVSVSVGGATGLHAIVQLERSRPFLVNEVRLMGLLAEVAGRACDALRPRPAGGPAPALTATPGLGSAGHAADRGQPADE